MPGINFTYGVPRILTGVKRTTIRPFSVKYQRMSLGCPLYLFTGLRTKYCVRLGSSTLIGKDPMTTARLFHLIHHDSMFVLLDGFDDPATMDSFFQRNYLPEPSDFFVRLTWGALDRCEVTYNGIHYPKATIPVIDQMPILKWLNSTPQIVCRSPMGYGAGEPILSNGIGHSFSLWAVDPDDREAQSRNPNHVHLAYFGSELGCEICNPVCYEKHSIGKLDWCGEEKCPMNPKNFFQKKEGLKVTL